MKVLKTNNQVILVNNNAIQKPADEGWQPQQDWWDIESIITNDTEQYTSKYICLLRDISDTTSINLRNNTYAKTSDGTTYTSQTTITHTWDKTKDKPCSLGYKTRYVIYYTNNNYTWCNLPVETIYIVFKGFNNGYIDSYRTTHNSSLSCIQGIKYIDCSNLSQLLLSVGASEYFGVSNELLQSLTSLSNFSVWGNTRVSQAEINRITNNINFTNITYMEKAFSGFYGELNVEKTQNVTNFNNAFSSSEITSIKELDFNSATAVSNIFYECRKLVDIFSIKNIKISGISLWWSTLLTHDTLLRFINALYDYSTQGGTHTIQFGATNLAKLTNEEIEIGTAKGWTIS